MNLSSFWSPNKLCIVLVGALLAGPAPLAAQQVRRTLSGTRPDSTPATNHPDLPPGGVVPKARLGVIDGVVTDTGLVPLRNARISIMRTSIQVGTGPNGRFRIVDIPSGQYIVIVRHAGYHPTATIMNVPASDTLRLSYTLAEAPTELAPVVISADQRLSPRMMEFEARRKAGQGEFMTQEQIDLRNPPYATELLRTFSSINVAPTSGGGGQDMYYPVSARATGGMTPTGQATCYMIVYVDNVPMPAPFNLDLLPSPRDLMGIEVYAGAATTPPQFAGFNRGCGVILIWTKEGGGGNAKP